MLVDDRPGVTVKASIWVNVVVGENKAVCAGVSVVDKVLDGRNLIAALPEHPIDIKITPARKVEENIFFIQICGWKLGGVGAFAENTPNP